MSRHRPHGRSAPGRPLLAALLLALAPPWAAPAAGADTATLRRGALTIVYPAGRTALAEHVADLASRSTPRLTRTLGQAPGPATIHLVTREDVLRQAIGGGYVPPWALAVAVSSRQLIVVRADKVDVHRNRLGATLTHELAHLAIGALERRAGQRLPQWFEEGVCEWVSGEPHFGGAQQLALDASLGQLLPFEELERRFPASPAAAQIAYAQSRAFVRWIEDHHPGALAGILQAFARGAPFAAAVRDHTGRSPEQLETAWRLHVTPKSPFLYALAHTFEIGTAMAILALLAIWRRRRRDRALLEQLDDPGEARERHGWRGPLGP